MKRKVFVSGLLLAVAAGARAGAAQDRAKSPAKEPAAVCPADDIAAAGAGLRAFVDPQTGQLREPTPEEARALAQAVRERFAREVETLEPVVHPDGMISLDLKGLFMQDLIVVRLPDGSFAMRCVPASETLAVPAAAPPPRPAPALEER